jgi:hypothetical protein
MFWEFPLKVVPRRGLGQGPVNVLYLLENFGRPQRLLYWRFVARSRNAAPLSGVSGQKQFTVFPIRVQVCGPAAAKLADATPS